MTFKDLHAKLEAERQAGAPQDAASILDDPDAIVYRLDFSSIPNES